MPRRIFICGTGRSGTWIVYKALNRHKAVHTFPREMRFLVDPDGLFDLVNALSDRHHPIYANEALYRFERLMKIYLTIPDRAPYRGFDFLNWLGADFYSLQLDQFIASMVEFEYEANLWQAEPEDEGRLVELAKRIQSMRKIGNAKPFYPYRITLPRRKERVVKYFEDRSQIVNLAASFVDNIFLHPALKNGKETWCEKTPQTLLNLDFIQELFPESLVIHMKRDPRGVVHSLTKQFWAPNDIIGACLLMRNMLIKWFMLKDQLDLDGSKYLEVKLEDFAEKPRPVLEKIASYANLENSFDDLPEILPERVNNWEKEMKGEEIKLVNEILGLYIRRMGYSL